MKFMIFNEQFQKGEYLSKIAKLHNRIISLLGNSDITHNLRLLIIDITSWSNSYIYRELIEKEKVDMDTILFKNYYYNNIKNLEKAKLKNICDDINFNIDQFKNFKFKEF